MNKVLRYKEDVAIHLAFKHGRVTRRMLMEAISIHRSRAHGTLQGLVMKGFLVKEGVGRNTFYTLRKLG
jgi:predicted HTH transcriptional regulator